MDLSDIVKQSAAAAAQVDTPKGWSVLKAKGFYQRIVDFVETDVASASQSIKDGFIRASAIPSMLGNLPLLRMASSYDIFTELAKKPEAGAQATFDYGTALHWWFQHKYLGPMGALWGEWRCVKCDHVEEGVMPVSCEKCDCERFDFVETWIGDTQYRYRGHADGLIVEEGATEPTAQLEIKSISTAGWDRLTEPMDDHMVQTHAYMRAPQRFLLDDRGDIYSMPRKPVRECFYLYIDKGKQALWRRNIDGSFEVTSPPRWKVFHRFFDDHRWMEIAAKLDEMWAIHDQLKGVVNVIADIDKNGTA